jgi:hypothetical protein
MPRARVADYAQLLPPLAPEPGHRRRGAGARKFRFGVAMGETVGMGRVASWIGCAALLCAPGAVAAEVEESAEHEREHGHTHRVHVGAMGSAVGAFTGGESFSAVGDGLFVTWIAVPHRFEVELAVRALATEGGLELSEDLLAKVPFHVRPWFHPFIGLGPTVAEYFVGGETRYTASRHGWGVGGALSVGGDFWLTRDFAFVLELSYNLLYRQLTAEAETTSALVNEFGGSAGALVAF